MKNLMMILLMISVTHEIAHADVTLSDDSVNNQELSFFESLFGGSQDTKEDEVKESNEEKGLDEGSIKAHLDSLLHKQVELLYLFEDYKNNTDIELERLRQLIDENSSKTIDVKSKLTKSVKDSTAFTNRSIENLKTKHKQLDDDFKGYKNISELDIEELKQSLNTLSANLEATTNTFDAKVDDAEKEVRKSIASLNEVISEKTLYWLLSILLVVLFLLASFFFSKKQMSTNKSDMVKRLQETRRALEEEHVSLDSKLIEIIESQLNIINNSNDGSESDHSLALKVADEIVRIQKNVSRMDDSTKGLKQLKASVSRIQDNFISNGYEIVDMLGKAYNEGMKVVANFIPDESLDEGQQVITRIIKPQVNYKNVMIQSAQIEVSLGE